MLRACKRSGKAIDQIDAQGTKGRLDQSYGKRTLAEDGLAGRQHQWVAGRTEREMRDVGPFHDLIRAPRADGPGQLPVADRVGEDTQPSRVSATDIPFDGIGGDHAKGQRDLQHQDDRGQSAQRTLPSTGAGRCGNGMIRRDRLGHAWSRGSRPKRQDVAHRGAWRRAGKTPARQTRFPTVEGRHRTVTGSYAKAAPPSILTCSVRVGHGPLRPLVIQ